jgi:hypothetical protein
MPNASGRAAKKRRSIFAVVDNPVKSSRRHGQDYGKHDAA